MFVQQINSSMQRYLSFATSGRPLNNQYLTGLVADNTVLLPLYGVNDSLKFTAFAL